MTKKDFVLISEILNKQYKNIQPKYKEIIKSIIGQFSVKLQTTNEKFDMKKFIDACTL